MNEEERRYWQHVATKEWLARQPSTDEAEPDVSPVPLVGQEARQEQDLGGTALQSPVVKGEEA